MEIHPYFKELLCLFANFHVEYIIVGGYALAFHGTSRYTGDLDVLVSTGARDSARTMNALLQISRRRCALFVNDFVRRRQGRGVARRADHRFALAPFARRTGARAGLPC